jgi:hypothetical protein
MFAGPIIVLHAKSAAGERDQFDIIHYPGA